MSYNYDECVQAIHGHRHGAHTKASASDAKTPANAAIASSAPDLEALQHSMEGFATLSEYCPMTPLLWMQYSHDTEVLMEGLMRLEAESAASGGDQLQRRLQQSQAKKSALESSTGILELAIGEFPGCALLQLYYLESLADAVYQGEGLQQLTAQSGAVGMALDDGRATQHKLSTAFEQAWKSVGRGTHVNEGMVVSEIYRLYGSFLLFCLSSVVTELKNTPSDGKGAQGNAETHGIMQQLSTLFQNWSQTPMGEGSNDDMMQDMEYFWDEACLLLLSLCDGEQQRRERTQNLEQQKAALWATIDDERKKTSSLMNALSSYENEIDVAMSNEGIVLPRSTLFPQQQEGSQEDDLGSHTQSLKRSSAKWEQILTGDSNRFLLGLGGSETSRAFLKATSFFQRIHQGIVKRGKTVATADRSPLEAHVATYKFSIIKDLYERAVTESPTSEPLWVTYLNFLREEWTRLRNKMKDPKMLQGEELRHQQQEKEELLSALQSASHRAVRNCPYSSTLFEIRMTTLGLISVSNLEPDDITAVVQQATELGFLNHNREAMLHLRLVAVLVVKRRLLSLVSLGTTTTAQGLGKEYEEGEEMGTLSVASHKNPSNGDVIYQSLNPSVMEEVQDLLEDIRDMYEEADNFLFKAHPTWQEGKVVLCKHRALTEAYVLCPIGLALKKAFHNDDDMAEEKDVVADKAALECFEKLVKAQKPSHPDSWREYIRYISTSHLYLRGNEGIPTESRAQPDGLATALSTLRKTRGLYNRAMSSVKKAGQDVENGTGSIENTQTWIGKGIDGSMFHRDYDAALLDLCHEYLEFERTSGSEGSFSHAQTLIRSKLANLNPLSAPSVAMAAAPVPNNQEEAHGKRKLEISNNNSQPENGSSMITESPDQQDEDKVDTQSKSKRVKVKTDLKQPKKTDGVHKVCIGKMEYPAHPYTIHVSNLSKETQDMDLVDALRPEFGDIVHAKILRDKRTGHGGHHFHGDSKCAGLVQFEERSSVENALQKSGEFVIGGKLVKIQRSHLPAVGLVPSGMHRVNPKGKGKITKRNKFKKESKIKVDTNVNMDVEKNGKGTGGNQKKNANNISAASPSSISFSALSFKPRVMRQKPKISLDSKKK